MVLPAELLWSYVPGFLASRFLARPMPLDAPGVERFLAAVLFADISGFTPLAERLARRGPTGAEALSNLLNAYFAELMSLIAEHGGEVITFAGDGLLAVWPASDRDEGLVTATCGAGRCALAVQSALGGYQTLDGLRLSLRIGVGAGEVMALRIGGDGGRWQLLLAGAPVVQGGLAEQQAARGEVVLSPEAWTQPPAKLKRPGEWVIGMVRATGITQADPTRYTDGQVLLGEPLWRPPSPKGFPDDEASWIDGMGRRLDVANNFAERIAGRTDPQEVIETVFGSQVSPEVKQAVGRAESRQQALVLLFMSAEFQRR